MMADAAAAAAVNANAHLNGMPLIMMTPVTQIQTPSSAQIHRLRKIFVGGLPSSATETELRHYFGVFGAIDSCIVMMDRQTGRSRGFGFVTFSDDGAVEMVMKHDRHVLLGKIVECKRAVPKEIMEMINQSSGQPSTAQKRVNRRIPRVADQLAGMGGGMGVGVGVGATGSLSVANPSQMLRHPYLMSFNANQTQTAPSLAAAAAAASNAASVNAHALAAYSASIAQNTSSQAVSQMAPTHPYPSNPWLPNDSLAAWYATSLANQSAAVNAVAAQVQAQAHAQAQAQAQVQAANATGGLTVNAFQSSLLNAHAAASDDLQKRMAALAIASAAASPSAGVVDNAAKQGNSQALLSNVAVNSSAAAASAANAASYNQAVLAWYHQLQSGVVDHSHAHNTSQNNALTVLPLSAQAAQFAAVPATSWISPASSAALSANHAHAHVLSAANTAQNHAQTHPQSHPPAYSNSAQNAAIVAANNEQT